MPTCTLHCAVIDGVFEATAAPFGAQGEGAHFHEASTLREDIAAVQRTVCFRVLRLFARRGLITPEAAAEVRQWEHGGGFSLNAAVGIKVTDPNGLERLLRYLCPPYLCR